MKTPIRLLAQFLLIAFTMCMWSGYARAVEVAPRISDREIIESLAILKQGQVDLNRRFDEFSRHVDKRFDEFSRHVDQRFANVDKRFANVDKRFANVDKRFDEFSRHVDQRFANVDKRFDDINKRLDVLQNTMLVLFGAIITLIVALFGYIAWDRRTALKPLQDRIERIDRDLQRDLELMHQDGSRLTRLVEALRELAKTDPKIAEVLRSFSLL